MRRIYNQGDLLKKCTCTSRSLQRERWGQHIGHDKECTRATDAHVAPKLHSKEVLMWSFCLRKTGTNSLCPLWPFVFTAVYNVWYYVKANYVLRLSPGRQMRLGDIGMSRTDKCFFKKLERTCLLCLRWNKIRLYRSKHGVMHAS